MTRTATRLWYLVHKWSSLVCTAFLLMLCVTGLPLIFHEEIDAATRAPTVAASARGVASLDNVMADALARHPGFVPMFVSYDDEKPLLYATVAPTPTGPEDRIETMLYDSRTGARVDAPPLDEGVMAFLLRLHANLLLGIPGQLFLGLIGVVFIVALVSGVVVYAPFMRKLPFGTVRRDRTARLKWLDTHNTVGIVTLGWVGVVGLSGFIITMTLPITMIWQADQLAGMAAPYADATPPTRPASVDRAVATARAAVSQGTVGFVAYPGTSFSTKHHYMVGFNGDTPLTRRLVRPAMVDAGTGRLTEVGQMPWYVSALFLSAPLHFGDYGGLPLKIVWALLDLAAIAVLGTGLYLWVGRRQVSLDRRVAELSSGGLAEAAE